MASVYNKNGIIYISWWEPGMRRTRNLSTGLSYSRDNLRIASRTAKKIEEQLSEVKNKSKLGNVKTVNIQTAFNHFLENNIDKHKSTISEYNRFFNRFTSRFPAESNCRIIDKLSVENWLSGIKTLKLERNTKYGIVKNLKKFLSFLHEYNYLQYFKLNKDVVVKPEVKEIIIFEDDDLIKIINGLDIKNPNFRTMILTLVYTGLRPTDIINIQVKDIDFAKQMLKYYSQKTKQPFIIPIHEQLIPTLHTRCAEIQTGNLFNYGGSKEMGKAFQRYLEHLKLDGKKYNLRTFRKTFISLAYQNGIDLAMVSKLVGHSNISTTAKFYNKIMLTKQNEQLNRFTIPQQKKDTKNENYPVK